MTTFPMTAPPMTATHRLSRFAATLLMLLALSGATAWWRVYSHLTAYDDEGTLMLSVQRFFDGGILYDAVTSIYGPLFYFCQWLPHAFTGAPVTHDSVRVISAAFWVASALVCFLLVYRATGSLLLAIAAHFTSFRVLRLIGTEVSHPHEICILLLLGVAMAACFRGRWSMIWIGALVGGIAMTKINLAILAAAAVGVVFSFALDGERLRRWLMPLAVAGALAVPFLLMSANLGHSWAIALATLTTLSLASAMLAAGRDHTTRISLTDCGIALLGACASAALIASFALLHGSTLAGMFQSLVLWPRLHFAQGWSLPLDVPPVTLAWAAANLALAWLYRRGRLPGLPLPSLKLLLAAAVVIMVGGAWYTLLINIATPMLWLVACPPPGQAPAGASFLLRPVLAITGVLQVLYAYPVAGGQKQFVSVLIVVAAGLCFSDALPWLRERFPFRPAASLLVLVFMAAYLQMAYAGMRVYQAAEPLGLRGAVRLRAEPWLAASLRRLVAASEPCSMLLSEPGMLSLNLFSGRPAPSTVRSGPWMLLLSEPEQEAAVREIQAQPRPCVIYNPHILKVWTQGKVSAPGPLQRLIREGFHTEFETEGYQFMVRN